MWLFICGTQEAASWPWMCCCWCNCHLCIMYGSYCSSLHSFLCVFYLLSVNVFSSVFMCVSSLLPLFLHLSSCFSRRVLACSTRATICLSRRREECSLSLMHARTTRFIFPRSVLHRPSRWDCPPRKTIYSPHSSYNYRIAITTHCTHTVPETTLPIIVSPSKYRTCSPWRST